MFRWPLPEASYVSICSRKIIFVPYAFNASLSQRRTSLSVTSSPTRTDSEVDPVFNHLSRRT